MPNLYISYRNNFHYEGLRRGTLELNVRIKNTTIKFKENSLEVNDQPIPANKAYGNGDVYVKKLTEIFYTIDGLEYFGIIDIF